MLCEYCKTVLIRKKSNKYKTIFTCRKKDCFNYNKDVYIKLVN